MCLSVMFSLQRRFHFLDSTRLFSFLPSWHGPHPGDVVQSFYVEKNTWLHFRWSIPEKSSMRGLYKIFQKKNMVGFHQEVVTNLLDP